MTTVHEGFRTGAGYEGVATEDVVDAANVVGVDFVELLCEMVLVEKEDFAVVLVVPGVVFLGTLMVVVTVDPDSMQVL